MLRAGIDERWVDGEHHDRRRGVLEALLARLLTPPPTKVPLDELDEREADMT